MSADTERRYRFGPFELRPQHSLLLRDGRPVEIQPQTLDALTFFVERGGQLVTKEELYVRLWPDTFVNEEALTQVVRKLRVALDDDAREPRYLQTVLKRGHRFIGDVEVVEAAPVESRTTSSPQQPGGAPAAAGLPESGASHRRRWLAPAALALLGVVAIWGSSRRLERKPESALGRRVQRVRLTATPEREQEAVFSPDGKSYAFAAYDAASAQFDLYLSSLAGGNRIRLTQTPESEYYPQFSPAGDAIAFTRGSGDGESAIVAISPLGGNERVLVEDAAWGTYSPDGRSLAYARRSESGWRLLRRDLERNQETEVTRFGGIGSPAWSPDGRFIVFTDQRAVWLVEATGGTPRQIGERPEALRSLAWERSGEAILCDASWSRDGTHDIWRLPLSGGPPEPVSAIGGAFHPATDGRRLLVTVEHKIRQLWRVDERGRNPTPVGVSTTVECLDVEPTGRWLAISDWSPRPGESSLSLYDLVTSEARPVADGTCAAVSADGKRIAYFGVEPAGLWAFTLGENAPRRLVERTDPAGFVESNLYRKPAWSPHGREVAYPGVLPDAGLHVVGADGQGGRRLAAGSFGPPAYSPDGRFIAALGRLPNFEAGVHVVDVASGRIRSFGPPWHYARAAPVWAADGRSFRILVDEAIAPALLHFAVDGREVSPRQPLARVPDPAFWGIFDLDGTPDGGYIYLLERYEGDLYLLTPAGDAG